jgi:hypothetical protein
MWRLTTKSSLRFVILMARIVTRGIFLSRPVVTFPSLAADITKYTALSVYTASAADS